MYTHQSVSGLIAWKALSVSTARTFPPIRKESSHTVSMILIFGSIDDTSSRVLSSDFPTATTISSQIGKIERNASSIGNWYLTAFLIKEKPVTFILYYLRG